MPPPQIFFLILGLKMATLGAFWIFLAVQMFGLNAKKHCFVAWTICMQRATQAYYFVWNEML